MRQARIKIDEHETWYHCYNRVVGTRADRPFGDVEKEQFVRLLHRVSLLYGVRVVAYHVMSNHFHLLVHAPVDGPGAAEMCQRYRDFHQGRRTLEPDSPACGRWRARSRDISWFMRHLQQLFTVWYNRTRSMERRGPLWTDRFKHTILESGRAVWGCWIYIENNAVRAGMVSQASDYRFGSHGVWQQSGRHPFAANIEVVALPMLQKCFGISGLGALRAAMQEALGGKEEQDLSEDECVLQVQRRVRYWTQGLVIGSKLFVTNVMSRHRPVENLKRHRSARLVAPDGTEMYAWNRLRVLVGT